MGARLPTRCDTPPPAYWEPPVLAFRSDRLPSLPTVDDPGLLEWALRHKSASPDANDLDPHVREAADLRSNRRLEWEGDTVLSWLVSFELAQQFPTATAGDLSYLRSLVVSNRTLSHLSWTYGFSAVLEHNPNDAPHRLAVTHQKILADAFEAYFGACCRPPLSQAKLREFETYFRKLLDPSCAIGLVEAAAEFRERRLRPDTLVPLASPPEAPAAPPARSLRGSAIPTTAIPEGAEVGWVETSLGGRWSVTLQLDGRPIVTAEGTKRIEAQQRAVALLVHRLHRNPRARPFLFATDELETPPN